MIDQNEIETSRREYLALPDSEWRKDYFDEATGGFVATHVLKNMDDLNVPGIAAEVKACFELAVLGKHLLRLPENIPERIDTIAIDGRPYRELLKYRPDEIHPRGYPDAYFDGQTWDFKTSSYGNDDTLRHRIKDGRKADNVVFISNGDHESNCSAIKTAIGREAGSRLMDGTWRELPNIYYLSFNQLIGIWIK